MFTVMATQPIASLVASLPSPSSGSISIGPLELRAYGLLIGLGVVVGVELIRRRWAARGGDPNEVTDIAMWAVPAGLIGARMYHVATDWQRFEGNWGDAFAIWKGGLGIPGGIALGVIVALWRGKKLGIALPVSIDVAAPGLVLAQAIGRFGNWFNQELYGRATDVPWALEIDPDHRPLDQLQQETFHPTFLYEALWNVALCGLLLFLDNDGRGRGGRAFKPGHIFAMYVGGYAVGRLWIETVRIDEASLIAGVRVNIWMMSLILLVALGVMLARGPFREAGPVPAFYLDGHVHSELPPPPAVPVTGEDVVDADDDGTADGQAADDEPVIS